MQKKQIILIAFVILTLFAAQLLAGEKEVKKEIRTLYRADKFQQALRLVESGLKQYPDSLWFYEMHYKVLDKLGKHKEALAAIQMFFQKTPDKTPGKCINVARMYMKLNDADSAFSWLDKAVKMGYRKFLRLAEVEELMPLQDDPRYAKLVAGMKANTGFGKPPKDFTFTSLDGKQITLSKQKGKVILVDVWATWCPPCVKEVPNLRKIYADYKDKGFEILGISVDMDKDKLEEYIKKEKVTWPIGFTGKGWQDDVRVLYNIYSIPSMWLIDREGILRQFDLRGEDLSKAVAELVAD